MTRRLLSDEQWERIAPMLPKERGRRGRPYKQSHRTTVEGILWIARAGAPWRDLPSEFGKWGTVYQRFNRWAKDGTFAKLLSALDGELDLEVAMVDGSYVRVHQHAAGALKEVALPTDPEKPKRLGEAEEGSPPRSPCSPTDPVGSRGFL